jgi:hypothetical protein
VGEWAGWGHRAFMAAAPTQGKRKHQPQELPKTAPPFHSGSARTHSLTHTHNHNCNHHGRGGGTAHLPPTLSHRHHRHRHHRHRHHLQSRSSAPHIHTSTSTRARTHAYIQLKHAQVASGGTTPSTPPPRNPRPPWTPRPAPRATTHALFSHKQLKTDCLLYTQAT